ncbi:MAG: hypothetical protein R3E79_01055 [Caldilineaceae bacterium]
MLLTLSRHDIEVIFYITPVNVELGDVYIGDTFRHQFAENVAVIQEQLAAQGVDLLDLSFDLAAAAIPNTCAKPESVISRRNSPPSSTRRQWRRPLRQKQQPCHLC